MIPKATPAAIAVTLIGLAVSACSGGEKGACVRNSGTIIASCGDDFTAANCSQYGGGDAFYGGKTCADLGFGGTVPYGIDDTREGRVTASVLQGRGLGMSGEPLRIPVLPASTDPQFVTIPDGPALDGGTFENSFAALPVGSRIVAVANGKAVDFSIETEPVLYESAARLVPTRGVVTHNYTVLWRGHVETLEGLWVFVDDEGTVGRLESVSWPSEVDPDDVAGNRGA